MQYLSELVAQWGLKAILTCSLDRTEQFVSEAAKDMQRSNGSLCIRLFAQDIQQSTNILCSRLEKLLQKVGTKRSTVDLTIDLGVVDKELFNEKLDLVCKFLNVDDCVSDWNSIILTCSSFPNSLKGIKADTVIEIPRVDYQLWEAIPSSRLSPKRIPIFGDYGIVSALYTDQPDFRSANIPTKIRYTLDDRWLVFKGGTTKKYGFEYYRKLSKAVMKLKDYKGENFSWGDRFISDCATGKGNTGNMASWVCADTTHHITHVVNQLSN